MFERLGTPAEHKKRLTYPRGHTVPKVVLITESLAWFDPISAPSNRPPRLRSDRPYFGVMLTLFRKKFAGSYLALISWSRGRFGPYATVA